MPKPDNPQDFNRYAYVRNSPLKYEDPSGHCPAPPTSTGNVICVAGFIPTKTSEGAPQGWVLYEGDNRGFSSNSTGQSSRFYVWIDADTGKFIGNPDDNVHPTVQLHPPQRWANGGSHAPRDGHNTFYVEKQKSGAIYFTYSVVCAGLFCQGSPGPEGEMVFIPNASGSYNTVGAVEQFPNIEAYHYRNGVLQSPYLFRLQNFSEEERKNNRAYFSTGMNMIDWWRPRKYFESRASGFSPNNSSRSGLGTPTRSAY